MAVSRKQLNEGLKAKYLPTIVEAFENLDLEVLRVASNEVAIPVLNEENEEEWLVITVKVPTGTRDGDAYDGYSEAEFYKMKCAEKAEKAKESAKKKAEKIAKDKAMREAKAKAKAEHESKKSDGV